jgi:indolepyruvate ferredoxin oxidoreductase beta subunit
VIRQQLVISGVGGQGVLFITGLLAEAALELNMPVLSSETHGMAQRGGTVISHLKIGSFHSPLIRSGQADVLIALTRENLLLHRRFLCNQASIFTNSPDPSDPGAIDATGIAQTLGSVVSANLVLLGFALSSGRLYCDVEVINRLLGRLLHGDRLTLSRKALKLGLGYRK